MMEPQGLIFDCDGTLADSMPIHWRAWEQTCNRHGLKFTEERHYALGGTPSRIIFEILGKEQGVALDPLALSQEKEAAYLLWGPWMCDCNHSLVGIISLGPAGNYDFEQKAKESELCSIWILTRVLHQPGLRMKGTISKYSVTKRNQSGVFGTLQ